MLNGGVLLGLTREVTPSGRLPVVYNGEGNVLEVAEPGRGKSRSIVMTNLIRSMASEVVLDFSGELTEATALWRAAVLGQYVVVYDPFRVVRPEYLPFYGSKPSYGSVNAIDFIRSSDNPLSDAMRVARAFMVEGQHRDAHWSDAAKDRFTATLLFVALDPRLDEMELPRNMETVWSLLSDPQLEKMSLAMMALSDNSFVADQGATFRKIPKGNTELSAIRNHLRVNCTETLSEPRVIESMLETNIYFAEMNRRPMTVYLVLPAAQASSQSRLMRYQLSLFIGEIERAGVPKRGTAYPVHVWLDEFPVLGKFPMVIDAMARLRKYGVKFISLVQTLSQLRDSYGDGWRTIAGTAGVFQFFGGTNDTWNAEEISKACGIKTERTISVQQGGRPGDSGSTTYAEDRRSVYTTDEIMRLPGYQTIIKVSGMNPMREVLFHPDLREFPDYQAFMAANDNGLLLSQATQCAKRVAKQEREKQAEREQRWARG